MLIRRKTILIIITALTVVFALLYTITLNIFLKSYINLELSHAESVTLGVKKSLQHDKRVWK
ncbi:MAG TPA: hypothetical protein PKK26_00520 [Candidatus Wallbacteria bacterium]|nr:hypothetical protein [Candidatus Wallbacteria bacterium]